MNYRFLPSLQAGFEYNPVVGEVAPLATWFLMHESHVRPLVFLGTSSDRIGSPEGTQAYYATFAKNLEAIPVSPYASLNWSTWDDGFNVPFGAYIHLGHGLSVQPMYDGERTHLLATYATGRFSVSAIWAWLEEPGVAASVGF